ncbi:MAG: hypothetical protein AAGJ83_06320, partial [Planctomycetota bacterium]
MASQNSAGRCSSCGAALEPSGQCGACLMQLGLTEASSYPANDVRLPSLEELNDQFPQLEVKRLIGRGGMGAVYH